MNHRDDLYARQVNAAFLGQVAIDISLPFAAMICGAGLVTGAGWFAASRLMNVPPFEALRSGG